MFNAALAGLLLALVSPVLWTFDDRSLPVQIFLVVMVVPVLLVVGLCLASALRPGSLGRAARRLRARSSASSRRRR